MEKIKLNRPFRILAHRGASGYAPENTFASFDLALTMQPEAIETDLRLTGDGVIAVFHDETVDRTTAGSGKVADLTYEELARLPLDGEHSANYPPQWVPRIEDLLDRYWGRVPLCLEIKVHGVIEPLVSLLRRRGKMDGHVEFTSFEPEAAHAIQAELPDAKVGMLVRDFEPATSARVADAGFAEICPSVGAATPGRIAAAHALGLSVRVYGIKTIDDLKLAVANGADGTTLNWPDWVERSPRPQAHLLPSRT
jgi:glycerophosphoryl diester phosphodiesterase